MLNRNTNKIEGNLSTLYYRELYSLLWLFRNFGRKIKTLNQLILFFIGNYIEQYFSVIKIPYIYLSRTEYNLNLILKNIMNPNLLILSLKCPIVISKLTWSFCIISPSKVIWVFRHQHFYNSQCDVKSMSSTLYARFICTIWSILP